MDSVEAVHLEAVQNRAWESESQLEQIRPAHLPHHLTQPKKTKGKWLGLELGE